MRISLLVVCLLLSACSGGGGNTTGATSESLSELRDGLATSMSSPYSPGPFATTLKTVAAGASGAPTETLVISPSDAGRYAIVQFQHGFILDVNFYTTILTRLAEHGLIVVAPQMYPPGSQSSGSAPSITAETDDALLVNDWIRSGLNSELPANVIAETGLLGIAGHSRGGQVAWRVLLEDATRASAIVGVDPVDSGGPPFGPQDPFITANPFNLDIPSLSLGTGLGSDGGSFNQPCAPAERNYEKFYTASNSPAWQNVADDHGHNDMLDDACSTQPECGACTAGPDRATMRDFTGGQLVALFRHALQGISARDVLENQASPPLTATAISK